MRMSTVCRPSIHGCLTGITGLQAAGAIQLQANQTTMLVNSMLEVQVTSLPQADRMMALTILLRALQVDNSASKLVIGADSLPETSTQDTVPECLPATPS